MTEHERLVGTDSIELWKKDFREDIEKYITKLHWYPETKEEIKDIVIGNLRGLAQHIEESLGDLPDSVAQKSYSLGITQGIEMVEKALPEEVPTESKIHTADLRTMSSTQVGLEQNKGFNTCLSEVKQIIHNLKK